MWSLFGGEPGLTAHFLRSPKVLREEPFKTKSGEQKPRNKLTGAGRHKIVAQRCSQNLLRAVGQRRVPNQKTGLNKT